MTPKLPTVNTDQDRRLIGQFAQREGGSKAGIEVSVTEGLSEGGECGFSGEVAGCDVVHFELVMESCDGFINVRVTRRHEMTPPSNQMEARIKRARRCTIFSMPGCEQPTTITMPSGVLIASDNSRNSSVPGLSDTNAMR